MEGVDKSRPTEAWIVSLRERYPIEPYVDKALTRKLRLRTQPPYVAQTLEGLQRKLETFLAGVLSGPFEVSGLKPLTGGLSKEQFSFVLQHGGASERLVLRTQAAQSAAETHRFREFELMGALQGELPVSQPRWIDPEGEVFDNPTLICTFCEGVAKPPGDGPTDLRMFYGPEYRPKLGVQFIELLARLATVDPSGLTAFEVPPVGRTAGVLSLVDWWARVWEEDSVEPDPLMTLAEHWLRRNAPPIDHVSIVHGDYRSGNFLFDPDTAEITAVLDWELASVGDRHLDLAYALLPLFAEPGEHGESFHCGLVNREDFLGRYEQLSGLPVDPVRLDYYEVLASWRNLVMITAGGARCVREQKTHQDVSMAWFVGLAEPSSAATLRASLSGVLEGVR